MVTHLTTISVRGNRKEGQLARRTESERVLLYMEDMTAYLYANEKVLLEGKACVEM